MVQTLAAQHAETHACPFGRGCLKRFCVVFPPCHPSGLDSTPLLQEYKISLLALHSDACRVCGYCGMLPSNGSDPLGLQPSIMHNCKQLRPPAGSPATIVTALETCFWVEQGAASINLHQSAQHAQRCALFLLCLAAHTSAHAPPCNSSSSSTTTTVVHVSDALIVDAQGPLHAGAVCLCLWSPLVPRTLSLPAQRTDLHVLHADVSGHAHWV